MFLRWLKLSWGIIAAYMPCPLSFRYDCCAIHCIRSRTSKKVPLEFYCLWGHEIFIMNRVRIHVKFIFSWPTGSTIALMSFYLLVSWISLLLIAFTLKIPCEYFCKQGIHGLEEPVFLSLPCVLGENGVTDIILQTLNKVESVQLHKSAASLHRVQSSLVLWAVPSKKQTIL